MVSVFFESLYDLLRILLFRNNDEHGAVLAGKHALSDDAL